LITWTLQAVPKSNPLSNYKKIVLKPADEIRLIRQIKVPINSYNIIR